MKGYVEIDQVRCKGCQLCIAFCPQKAISLHDRLNAAGYVPASLTKREKCTGCAICAIVCPEVTIEVFRE